MKVKLVNISKGAEYQNQTWDYCLTLEFKNQERLKVFDHKCLATNLKINAHYIIKLSSPHFYNMTNNDSLILEGKIVLQENQSVFVNEYLQIKLTDAEQLEKNVTKQFAVGRIDLEQAKPIHHNS